MRSTRTFRCIAFCIATHFNMSSLTLVYTDESRRLAWRWLESLFESVCPIYRYGKIDLSQIFGEKLTKIFRIFLHVKLTLILFANMRMCVWIIWPNCVRKYTKIFTMNFQNRTRKRTCERTNNNDLYKCEMRNNHSVITRPKIWNKAR